MTQEEFQKLYGGKIIDGWLVFDNEGSVYLNNNQLTDFISILWQEVGLDYQSRIIDTAIQESVKSALLKIL